MEKNIQSGLLTELSCQYDFSKFGIVLYAPITTDSRSDFIAEVNGYFLKIQCKSSTESSDGNSFTFSTSSKNWNTKITKNYKGQIDYFYTCHKGKGYLIPIEETGNKTKTLRLFAVDKNNSSINWASDYEIEKVLKELDSSLEEYVPNVSPPRPKSVCIDCGTEITYGATRCKKCSSLLFSYDKNNNDKEESKQKVLPINRGDLKTMIKTESFTSIAKKFGVSDNAIRKWCDRYNLPRTKREIKKYTDEEWNSI